MEVKSPKNKLRISFVGDKTKTIPVGDKEVFDIMLDADDHTLKEVVVKGSRAGSGGLFIPKREISVAQQTFDMSNVEGMAFTSAVPLIEVTPRKRMLVPAPRLPELETMSKPAICP